MGAVEGAAPVYASLYLREYQDRPEKFVEAVRQCELTTLGLYALRSGLRA